MSDEFRQALVNRRGRFEIFDRLDAPRTALIVIDMQHAFVSPEAPMAVPLAPGIVPNINRLAEALRRAGGTVAWIQTTLTDDDGNHPWPVYYEYFMAPDFAVRHLAALTAGSELHGLVRELDVRDGDLRVEKDRFSCFIQGASNLDGVLKARGVDTIIIVGTLTNRCCETTARDAMMIGYKVVFPEDANATTSDEEHVAALVNIASAFGDVRTTDEVVAMLGGSP